MKKNIKQFVQEFYSKTKNVFIKIDVDFYWFFYVNLWIIFIFFIWFLLWKKI